MSEATDVWLLAVALDGEDTFWLCEPSNLKPLPPDWKAANCRWLYPVVENISRFADLSGFESTDAVYEVEWSSSSKVLRAATLTWNVKCKRQKMGRTTYVFVPAEEMKLLDETYSKFVKLEAMKPPSPRVAPAQPSPSEQESAATSKTAEVEVENQENTGDNNAANSSGATASVADNGGGAWVGDALLGVHVKKEGDDEDGEVSVVSSSATQFRRTQPPPPRRSRSNFGIPSHKRQVPHRGTTIYQAPVHSCAIGNHCSSEAFDWPEMFLVHRGSVDFLCPKHTNNSYGFRLDRVTHDGFPVFLLFFSNKNNSETVDASARGVPVFEKAKLSGEAGEGFKRNSVLVLTRLSSKKHQPHHSNGKKRPARRRRSCDSDSESITDEDEDEDEEEDMEDDDDDDTETYEDETEEEEMVDLGEDDRPLFLTHESQSGNKRGTSRGKAALPPQKKTKAETAVPSEEETTAAPTRRRGRKSVAAVQKDEAPLQAVSVNFWTDPQEVTPAVSQLAREFPFQSEGASTPQTVVFSDGVCVTYTAATAAKYAPQEKRRNTPKHGHAAASTEDADLSMLNEHILNAFAQLRKEST